MCPEKTSNTNGNQLTWPATFAGETTQSKEKCPVNTQNRKLSYNTVGVQVTIQDSEKSMKEWDGQSLLIMILHDHYGILKESSTHVSSDCKTPPVHMYPRFVLTSTLS